MDEANAAEDLNISISVPLTVSMAVQSYNGSSYVDTDAMEMTIDNGNYSTNTVRVTTETNSEGGYILTLADADDITSLAPFTETTINNITTYDYDTSGDLITPVPAGTALTSFTPNTWGYASVTTTTSASEPATPSTYDPVTADPITLYRSDDLGSNYHYLTTAAKVGDTLSAGVYQDEIVLSLIAKSKPKDPSRFYALTYLQDMTASICSEVESPDPSSTSLATTLSAYQSATAGSVVPQVTLEDSRDGQSYMVRKMADGNCWMAENMRYGATTGGAARAYDDADESKSDNINTEKMSELKLTHITANSTQSGWFTDDETYYTSPYIGIYEANIVDDVSNTGTKFGAMYNYCAATGGTACTESTVGATVSGSICPAGWTLPSFENELTPATTTAGSLDGLMNAYNIANNTTHGVTAITSTPLSFPRAGGYYGGTLQDRSPTGYGVYWSATPGTTSDAYYLFFAGTSTIARDHYDHRSIARSVRCVAY